MRHPVLPATKSPKHACRPGWNRTAFAPLPAEQFHLRSFPGHWLATGRWSEADRRVVDLPDRRFRDESGSDIPQTGEVCFIAQLHSIQHDKLHRLEVVNCGKRNEINAERPRSRNAAKNSDEAGATPLLTAFSRPNQSGVAPAHHQATVTVFSPRACRDVIRPIAESK